MVTVSWVALYFLSVRYGNVWLFLIGMAVSYIDLLIVKTAYNGGFK